MVLWHAKEKKCTRRLNIVVEERNSLHAQITLLFADEAQHLAHLSKGEKIILKFITHNKTRKYGMDVTVEDVDQLCDFEHGY